FAALAIACVGAAAGGGYLATRQNVVPSPASAQMQPLPAAPPGAPLSATAEQPSATAVPASASRPVQETEAVVGDKAPSAPASSVAAPRMAGARRAEAEARTDSARDTRQSAPSPRPTG